MSQTNPTPTTSRRRLLSGSVALSLGAGVATLAGCIPAPASASPVPTVEPNADAVLLALCAEYVALDRAFCANSRAGADMLGTDPAWKALHAQGCAMVPRLHELEELIADTEPCTRAGLLAKAEAAKRSLVSDADGEDGGDLLADETHLACTVIENLLDMIGGQA